MDKERLVGFELAPDDAGGTGRAHPIRDNRQVFVESRRMNQGPMLAGGGDDIESDFVQVGGQFLGLGILADCVAEHPDIAAEGSRADRVFSLAAAEAKYFWRIAYRETQHADADLLRHREVSGFMHDHQYREDKGCVENRGYHQLLPASFPFGATILSATILIATILGRVRNLFFEGPPRSHYRIQ